MELDIAWDSTKAHSNLQKHGVEFTLAASALLDPLALTTYDRAHSKDEERWFTLGLARNGSLLAVSHTYHVTGPANANVRLISARPATRREREHYQTLAH